MHQGDTHAWISIANTVEGEIAPGRPNVSTVVLSSAPQELENLPV
jgi:hypothetical protein